MKAIILLGMTGNLLILVTVARSPAMRTTSNIYICNMAISGEDTGEIFNSLLEISELCNSQVWITLSVTISFLEIKSFQLFRHGDLPFPKFPRIFFTPTQTWWYFCTCSDMVICLTAAPVTPLSAFSGSWHFGWLPCKLLPLFQVENLLLKVFSFIESFVENFI